MNKVLVLLTALFSSGLAQAASVQSNQSLSLSSTTASTATSNAADTHVFVQALNPQQAGTVVENNGDWRYLTDDGSSISDVSAHIIQ
ncbi:MAG: hypothetical protein HWE18_05460, partial [Gammaproteobacteria bacterium]|nr:hypothetical protein [Gammaproteobacteria bacterium]